MAYKLGLFDREYYFYENISSYININIPRYIGTMKDSNFVSKGILLENINKDDFFLNLDLNKESIDVSLKVIEECAKFHGLFWNKDLSKSFPDLKKHNNDMFKPVWGTAYFFGISLSNSFISKTLHPHDQASAKYSSVRHK